MRKWMRDRLQRRKKTPTAPSDKPAPPPLQPAYFDAEQAPGPDDRENIESEISAPPPFSAEDRSPQQGRPVEKRPVRVADASAEEVGADREASQPVPRSSEASGRSRRRRGGRGRGGRGREQAVAQAFTPAAVKGSIPALPLEAAEEEMPEAEGARRKKKQKLSRLLRRLRAPAPAAMAQRPPKGVVVLAIGLPGSGKSSWFKRHNVVPLSSDMVRALLFDDVREQRFQDLVFSNLRSMLKARLIAKRPTNYVDATNLTPQERQHWIKLAKDYQYEVHAVFFDVPLEVCIERHERRDRVVPKT